jgi:ribosomal protein S12 methylthiotransferase accessory factor
MYLLLEDTDAAMDILEYSENRVVQTLVELIKMENEGKTLDEFQEALQNVFGKENLQKALAAKDLQELFIDTTFHKDYHNVLNLYDKLEIQKKAFFLNS